MNNTTMRRNNNKKNEEERNSRSSGGDVMTTSAKKRAAPTSPSGGHNKKRKKSNGGRQAPPRPTEKTRKKRRRREISEEKQVQVEAQDEGEEAVGEDETEEESLRRRGGCKQILPLQARQQLTKEGLRVLKEADRALRRRSGIHKLRLQAADKQLVSPSCSGGGAEASLGRLHLGWTCYVCKKRYDQLHFFYDQLCPWCSALNYSKRLDRANLTGRVALVTGGRVKIGFQCALRLLRCGASVIVTTRFPTDAALRYHAERDFELWQGRLSIYGLDLRGMGMVQLFTQFIAHTHSRLDIIINNAAQTIRRPPAYYAHLIPVEATPVTRLPTGIQRLLDNPWNAQNAVDMTQFKRALDAVQDAQRPGLLQHAPPTPSAVLSLSSPQPGPPLRISEASALSQVRLVPGEDDAKAGGELFPARALDADGQQIDLRPNNTWSARAHEVSGVEVMEVHAINAVAPYIITSQLLPLMLSHSPRLDKYVVNVSSMEGKFTRPHKDHRHPHTNMAKAALNMMTCTMAADYARDNIYINSVDTGWVTNEHAWGKEGWDDFTPPLDDIDGAARILQPIFDGVARGNFMSGLFLKDYSVTSW